MFLGPEKIPEDPIKTTDSYGKVNFESTYNFTFVRVTKSGFLEASNSLSRTSEGMMYATILMIPTTRPTPPAQPPNQETQETFINPSLAVEPLNGGTAKSSYGPWTWGTSITVTATPNAGWAFKTFLRNGIEWTGSNPGEFLNLQSGEVITATFIEISDGSDGGDGKQPPSGCFIATACYGSPTHARVCQLRALKDTLVAKSRIASFFYRVYYVFSPAVALKIGNMRKTKATIRKTIEVVWRLIRR